MNLSTLIMLLGILLVVPPAEAKSKKRKRRAPNKTEQTQTQKDLSAPEEKKAMDLESRCMSYCDYTTKCLENICTSNPTVSLQTCFNQCVQDKSLTKKEYDQTLAQGCLRTQSIFCQTGLLKDKCECPKGPQAQCGQEQHCNLPLSEARWACGTPEAELPSNLIACNAHHPCPGDQVCTGIYDENPAGICLSLCENKTTAVVTRLKTQKDPEQKPQPAKK